MKIIALLLVILALVFCFASCDKDGVEEIIERLPYDIEGWHEHSWDNWELVYDEVNVNLVCSLCEANVKSHPISQGLEIDENGVLWDRGTCKDGYIVVPQGVTAVGEGAFSNTKNILGVLLPETVTEIRDNAFKSCDGLQVINIPEGVTEIGDSAFHSCKSLIGVLVPHSVTKIGKQAFANCGYLEIIYYVGTEADWEMVEKGKNWDQGAGKHVVEFKMIIGDDPFVDTEESLEYLLNEDGKSYSVVGIGTCTSMDIVIPSTHKGLPVTAIGASAFYNDEITSVSIPNSVTNIGNHAFRECENLQNFTIPESVVSIGEKAFFACRSLTEVIIPDNVATIGPEAFRECSSLKSITLGKGLTVIENDMFHSCLALESIVIPDNIVTIRQEAFRYCTSLVNIDLGKGLKILENDVFHSCPVLKTIVIPDGVTILEVETFRDCYLLENVVLGKGITTIGNYALAECPALKTITIPDNVTVIGDGAFYCSTGLETVYIGSGLNSIVAWGFYGCKSLTSIYYNGTISQWNDISFGWYWDYDTPEYTIYCTDGTIAKDGTATYYEIEPEGSQGLEYALNADGQSYSVVGMGTCTDTELVIPSEYNGLPVTAIADMAFAPLDANYMPRDPYNIVSVKLPETIETIGSMAFGGIPTLKNVDLPDSIEIVQGYAFVGSEALEYAEYDGALYLGNENNPYLVFVNPKDTNVISCRIHDETKVIGGIAFNECQMLETVYLGDGVKYISPSAFMGCSMLSNFIIGEGSSLISIANSAFYGCSSLVNIELPNSLKNIDNSAFAQCTSLTKVVIPESVENIGEYAFEGCSSLTIYCEAESQPAEWNSNWNSKGAYSGDQFIPVIWGYKPE